MSLSEYAPYVIFGITDGSLYGLAAMGLVLSYKTSGVFNVAYGGIAAASAFCFYSLHITLGLAWGLSALLTVFVFSPIVGVLMELLTRGLAGVPSSSRLVGTVGLLIGLIALAALVYGDQPKQLPVFLPNGQAFRLGGAGVTWAQVMTFLLGSGSAAALLVFFRTSRLGLAMRAVVDDPQLLDMTGIAPTRVRRSAWIISCAFAGVVGPLLATKLNVDAVLLSFLVIQAFGAASLGFFNSLPLAFAGGITVGILQNLTTKAITGHIGLQNLDLSMPFLVLFVVLVVTPRRKLVEIGRTIRLPAPPSSRLGKRARVLMTLGVLAALAAIPHVVGAKLPIWNAAMPFVLVLLSLGLLVRTSGQVSLCQVGFMAVGGAAFGHLLEARIPWGIAFPLAGLAAVPVGAVVAVPAIRLSGLYLGLATLGVGVMLASFFYSQDFMFGTGGGVRTPRPGVLGLDTDTGYWYLMLAVVVAASAAVLVIERARFGRLLRGLGDAPVALSTGGLDVNITKVMVFCVSAFLAGLGGALLGSLNLVVDSPTYPYLLSLVLLAVIAIAGRRTVPAALLGALLYQVVPGYVGDATFRNVLQVGFGIGAITAALFARGQGFPLLQRVVLRTGRDRPGPLHARLGAIQSKSNRPVSPGGAL